MSTEELDSMLRGVASAPSVRPLPRIGDRLGDRYLIEAFLGEGGMGTVYRALDEKLGESVALKLVRRTAGDALRDEVRLAQKVTHANVCRTFDLEDVDGHHVIKMEYVAGETLSVRLRRDTKLPIDEVVRIARAIADGLAAAHAKQIVHGDLKPGNVMLDGDRVVLMDFGIARIVAAPIDGVRGTIGYIAPELVRNESVDGRADFYALGCLMYEMLAGEAVSGTGAAITDRVPDVRAKRPDTPRWLSRAVTELLAKRPDDRPAGIARLHMGSRSFARIIVLLALIAIGIAGLAMWRLMQSRPTWVADVHDFPTFDENGDVVSMSPDGEWIAFSSDRRDHGQWQPYVMSRRTGATTLLAPDLAAGSLRWTRDGRAMLFSTSSTGSGHIYRRAVTGTPPHFVGVPEDLGVGGEGDDCGDSVLIVVRGIDTWTVDLRSPDGTRKQLFSTSASELVSSARCDPSGQRIVIVAGTAYEGGGNDVYLGDRSGVHRITTDQRSGTATFTADGRALIISRKIGERLQLFEMGLDGDAPTFRRLATDSGPDSQADVSRDGRFLTFMRDTTAFYPIATTANNVQSITHESGTYFFLREVDRDTIVAQRTNGGPAEVVTVRIDDGTITELARGTSPFPSLDGTTIYFANGEALLSVPVHGGTPQRVATLPGAIEFGNAGPDALHVLVQTDRAFAAYRIVGNASEPEHTDGLVSVAAIGGWRAITRLAGNGLVQRARLELVPPDDRPGRTIEVSSVHNRWLDDHSISYCLRDRCEVYDVTADKVTTTLRLVGPPGLLDCVAADRIRVFESMPSGTVTRHIITNFDQR